jgi:hypothetical protein
MEDVAILCVPLLSKPSNIHLVRAPRSLEPSFHINVPRKFNCVIDIALRNSVSSNRRVVYIPLGLVVTMLPMAR